MSIESATLVAAALAAVASVLSILFKVLGQKNADMRAAHRDLMATYVEDLGRAIHESVATANVFISKIENGGNADAWRKKADTAKSDLATIRRRVRYSLWGIDEGLRDLTRLANWVAHCQDYPANANKLLNAADQLREALDDAIRHSYSSGNPPSWRRRKKVHNAAEHLRAVYSEVMAEGLERQDLQVE